MSLATRVVVVHRRSELDDLVARHGTRQQAAFFLHSRGRTLDDARERHDAQQFAIVHVAGAIPLDWRRAQVERSDLAHFFFAPEDIVVAVGQDGLVANVSKYLDGQPIIGVNPEPKRNPGLLVPHRPEAITALFDLGEARQLHAHSQGRTMVQATTDDGQTLLALNELYVGHPSHQSARYHIETHEGAHERQSSSGILVSSGTGATGWCLSVWRQRQPRIELPAADEPKACWFVREAWPSPATGADLTEGNLGAGQQLVVVAESDLVVFGDGIETDAIPLTWGQRVTLSIADQRLRLVA